VQAALLCPLVDLLLRVVASYISCKTKVLYILVLHFEESDISMVGSSLVSIAIKPILSSLEATIKDVMNRWLLPGEVLRMMTEGILTILIHSHQTPHL